MHIHAKSGLHSICSAHNICARQSAIQNYNKPRQTLCKCIYCINDTFPNTQQAGRLGLEMKITGRNVNSESSVCVATQRWAVFKWHEHSGIMVMQQHGMDRVDFGCYSLPLSSSFFCTGIGYEIKRKERVYCNSHVLRLSLVVSR